MIESILVRRTSTAVPAWLTAPAVDAEAAVLPARRPDHHRQRHSDSAAEAPPSHAATLTRSERHRRRRRHHRRRHQPRTEDASATAAPLDAPAEGSDARADEPPSDGAVADEADTPTCAAQASESATCAAADNTAADAQPSTDSASRGGAPPPVLASTRPPSPAVASTLPAALPRAAATTTAAGVPQDNCRRRRSGAPGRASSSSPLLVRGTPTARGCVLAVLERSGRQLCRGKLSLVLDLFMPLLFVGIAVALLSMWKVESAGVLLLNESQWYFGGNDSTARSYSLALDEVCVNTTGVATTALPFYACDTRSWSSAVGVACDADMSHLSHIGGPLCRRADRSWLEVVNNTLRPFLMAVVQIPTLDGVIQQQWVMLAAGAVARDLTYATRAGMVRNTRYSAAYASGMLYFVGPPSVTAELVAYMHATSFLLHHVTDGHVYGSVEAVRTAVAQAQHQRFWAIVELRQMDAQGLDLVLHMSDTAIPALQDRYDTRYSGGVAYDTAELYMLSGFNTLQQLVSEFYVNRFHALNISEYLYTGSVATVPYSRVPALTTASDVLPLVFLFMFLYSVSQQTKRIVLEKELRIREAMLIMGLQQWTLYVSELIVQAGKHCFVCVVAAVVLRATYVTKSDVLILFLIFLLFALTTIPLSGLIAALLNKAQHAALLGPVIYVLLAVPMVTAASSGAATGVAIALLSPCACARALGIFLSRECSSGCTWDTITSPDDSPTLAVLLGMLAADFFIYYLLMLYLDAVVPKEWGTPRHPLFFVLEPLRWGLGGGPKRLEGGEDGRAEDGVFEDAEHGGDVVVFDGLRKVYSRGGTKFVAVNNLYWGMREGEISVLLGHNGAGKTTVLNMMTGMVEPDEGDCYIYGNSVRTATTAVRQEIGYCPQHNILWSELTCRDHLEFFGKIKGLKGWELEDAMCRMLYETDLLDKMDQPAKSLSGGMKRKLSIAIAFVGGSRLVFLDEPTAGLDVGARRQTWELLKRMARARTLLLTTHYMDEADLLGSRIGIMSQGRLKCTGSSMFLKSRLGVGYHIVISVDPDLDPDAVDEVVLGTVSGAQRLGRNGCELSYQLPAAAVDEFPALLNEIDSVEADGIRGYSLAATTLEEVFLKVSEEDIEGRGEAVAQEDVELIWGCEVASSPLWGQFRAMLAKRLWCALRDRRMQCFQIVCPVVCILIAGALSYARVSPLAELVLDYDMFGARPMSELVTVGCERVWGPASAADGLEVVEAKTWLGSLMQLKEYLLDTWYVHESPRYGGAVCLQPLFNADFPRTYFTTHPSETRPSHVFLFNTSSYHQAALNLALHYNRTLQHRLQSPDVFMRYRAAVFNGRRSSSQIIVVFAGVMIAFALTCVVSTPAAWVVKERQCGSRYMQNLCGLNFFVYWAANFVFDMAAYVVTMLLCVLILAIFNRREFIGPDRVGGTLALFVVYGFTSTVGAYALSFAFKEHASAQAVITVLGFTVSFATLVLIFVFQMDATNMSAAGAARWYFWLWLPFCLGEKLVSALMLRDGVTVTAVASVWDMDQLGWPLVYMAAEFPVFCAVVVLLGHPAVWRRVQRLRYRRHAEPVVGFDEDSDVEDERRAVYEAESNHNRADVVRVVNLQKRYGNGNVAVKGITFSIFPGEVFGFLGTNGAGKTTTISMLCQQFLPTGGSAYVCGYDIVTESREALQCIGYCPQFDATLDLLTVEEQLQLYAGIRGIVSSAWPALVDALCTLCELTMYRKTVTSALSGGNRRKLSVAMSLVGGPQVVFLDEPSAGMDPVARRGMWTAIQRAAGHCSVVLTTHHLEEVEALADIVAIMVDGAVQCFGDAAYLKGKYGRVLESQVTVAAPDHLPQLRRFMKTVFPQGACVGGDRRRFVFHLPYDRPLGEVFAVLHEHCVQLHITSYTVAQTSIEETFERVKRRAGRRGRGETLHSSEIVAGCARVY